MQLPVNTLAAKVTGEVKGETGGGDRGLGEVCMSMSLRMVA